MRVQDALDQLDAIHDHLAKAEVYRGVTAPSVALVGVIGFLAAALEERVGLQNFVVYWLGVALLGALIGFTTTAQAYFFREDEFARRKTRRVLAQFLPSLAAGGIITAALARDPDLVPFLPGLWSLVFGLGLISARPYLPRGIGLVGLGYLLAGGVLLTRRFASPEFAGWTVGGVFGAGHLLTALVLWCDRPRDTDG